MFDNQALQSFENAEKLRDAEGNVRALIVPGEFGPTVLAFTAAGQLAGAAAFGDDGELSLSLVDRREEIRAALKLLPDGSAVLATVVDAVPTRAVDLNDLLDAPPVIRAAVPTVN